MDAEIQRRRTFEIIAKWVGKHNGVTITFQPDICPHADPKSRQIFLPSNMKIENLDKVLALVFHEAGHIAHSTFDMKKLIDNSAEKDTLNGCEDVRIDALNIGYLPKVKEFYEELVKWEDEKYPPGAGKKIPIPVQALLDAMRYCNGFHKYTTRDPSVIEFRDKHNIPGKINDINYWLACCEGRPSGSAYEEAKKRIQALTEIIFGKQKKGSKPEPQEGEGEGEGEGQSGQGQGQDPKDCSGKADSASNGKVGNNQNNPSSQKDPNSQNDPKKPDGKGKAPGGGFGLGHPELFVPDPNAHYALDDVSLSEQTVQAFNELLTVKSIRTIRDGMVLDTDNLTAYLTGQIDELFKEVKIEKYKKSKIMFLLDSSGSMMSNDGMCDRQLKCHTLISVGHKLTNILKELQETEGINVDFCVRGFDDYYHQWSNEEWEREYARCPGGGTNCKTAFHAAQEEILNDKSVDGNKLIIMITDGQVDLSQIKDIKEMVIKHNSDVKCLILGIGLHPQFTQILGSRNIISKDLADGEVLLAIQDMLE